MRNSKKMSNPNMEADERAQWTAILDAAAQRPPDEMNEEWEWLIEQLGLSEDYFLAVLEAIRQQRWRTATNPKFYVRKVAKREALKMGLMPGHDASLIFMPAVTGDQGSSTAPLEWIAHEQGTREAIRGTDGVWRPGGGQDVDYDDPRADYPTFRSFLVSKVPGYLKKTSNPDEEYKVLIDRINARTEEHYIHLKPLMRPNWEKWAEEAGFDQWDRKVLQYKSEGTSRDRALAQQPDETARKALQAAWRKFDRTGVQRLQKALKNKSS